MFTFSTVSEQGQECDQNSGWVSVYAMMEANSVQHSVQCSTSTVAINVHRSPKIMC